MKKIVVLMLLTGSLNLFAVKGRVVPISRHPQHGLSILLVFENTGHKTDYWTDFFYTARPNQRGHDAAQAALNDTTGGIYDRNNAPVYGSPWVTTESGDIMHITPVDFIDETILSTGSKNTKEFLWLPIKKIFEPTYKEKSTIKYEKAQPVQMDEYILFNNKKIVIDPKLFAVLKTNLDNEIQKILNNPNLKSRLQRVSSSSQASHAIPQLQSAASNQDPEEGEPILESFFDTELGNLYEHPIVIDGESWKSVEHYFQAQKAAEAKSDLYMQIKNASTALDAYNLGKQIPTSRNWKSKKQFEVMLHALRAKFEDEKLKNLLLKTGNAEIEANSETNDRVWTIAIDKGQNHLGRMLEHVRNEIRTGKKSPYQP